MAKKSKRAKSALPYAQRVVEDEYVQAQLRNALARLQEAWVRAARQGDKAAEDKKLYANLREAATSIRRAALRVQRKPPPKRRGRKLAVVALAGAGAALVLRRRRETQANDPGDPAAAPTNTTGNQPRSASSVG